jgi:hypothetical protein
MNILLVSPEFAESFWSLSRALRIIKRKSLLPPLGLLTVAAMLPTDWSKRLVDMNIEPLTDDDLDWADYVFLGGLTIQWDSAVAGHRALQGERHADHRRWPLDDFGIRAVSGCRSLRAQRGGVDDAHACRRLGSRHAASNVPQPRVGRSSDHTRAHVEPGKVGRLCGGGHSIWPGMSV